MGSFEAEPLNATAVPAMPVYGPPVLAMGATPATVAVAVADVLRPSVFVTLSVTVNLPAAL